MASRCSAKKIYAPDADGTWHAIVPRGRMRAYVRTADGRVVRVKGAAEARRFAGEKDGTIVVIAAAKRPSAAMFDTVKPVAVKKTYGTRVVKHGAWTEEERDLYDRLAYGHWKSVENRIVKAWARLSDEAAGPRFGIGVGPEDTDDYPAGFLPADGSRSLTDAAVHAPLPDPDAAWRLGRGGVDAAAAAAVLTLRQAGVPVAKSEQIMRRVWLIADTVEVNRLHRPGSVELDALLMRCESEARLFGGVRTPSVNILALWLLGHDEGILHLKSHTELLEAAANWQDDTAARLLNTELNVDALRDVGEKWRALSTLFASAAANPSKVGEMFGKDAKGWHKAARWAAGLPVEWGDDEHTAAACLYALAESRPEGMPLVGPDMARHGWRGVLDDVSGLAPGGFAEQRGSRLACLDGLASPQAYAELTKLRLHRQIRDSLVYERDPEVVKETLSLLPPEHAIGVAPADSISRVAADLAAQIKNDPLSDDSDLALVFAILRWRDERSGDDDKREMPPAPLDQDRLQDIADLVLGGVIAQARGGRPGVLDTGVSIEVPSMLGDRTDATAIEAAEIFLRHRNHSGATSRGRLHFLATPSGRRAFDSLTDDAQDGFYERIAEGIVRSDRETDLPDWWGRLPDRVQAAVGGRIAVADVFSSLTLAKDTKQCVRAAAAAAVADGLDGDPADPDTHPEWADLLGDTPGGHKVALIATNAAERGDADERTVKEILGLAPFVRPSNRPV